MSAGPPTWVEQTASGLRIRHRGPPAVTLTRFGRALVMALFIAPFVAAALSDAWYAIAGVVSVIAAAAGMAVAGARTEVTIDPSRVRIRRWRFGRELPAEEIALAHVGRAYVDSDTPEERGLDDQFALILKRAQPLLGQERVVLPLPSTDHADLTWLAHRIQRAADLARDRREAPDREDRAAREALERLRGQ